MRSKSSLKFGDVVSAVRKSAGMTQYELSKRMGLSQANLSKIESNQLKPAADLWVDFCQNFSVPVNSFKMGYIDFFDKKILAQLGIRDNALELPNRYRENAILRVRFLIPIFENLKFLFGEETFVLALKRLGIDPIFINIRDTQVNFKFVRDLLGCFEFDASSYNFIGPAEMSAYEFVHGKSWDKMNGSDVVKTINHFVKKVNLYFEGYYLRHEVYSHSQIKIIIPPFPTRPSFMGDVHLVEKLNYLYLPHYIKSLVINDAQVELLDEGPGFQIFIKG